MSKLLEYLPDSDTFRVHKDQRIAISNMDLITHRQIEGDFVLLKICFGCSISPLYRLKQEVLKSVTIINTEK